MIERKQETKLVKNELAKYGINARVGHGRGTAWGWLEMNVGQGQQFGKEHTKDEYNSHRDCPCCKAANIIMRFAEKVAQDITSRTGDYGGRICCLTQDHWTDKKGSIPIEHDLTKLLKAIPELKNINN
jgi:hypothetical protein